jgi:excisionase family DNA binding protein
MPELIDAKKAADILDVTSRWVTELLRTGRIKGQKVGNQWVVSRTEVERYKSKMTQEEAGQAEGSK